MNISLDYHELDYLIFTLGGRSSYNPKALGSGLSGSGALILLGKLETIRNDLNACPVATDRETETRAA